MKEELYLLVVTSFRGSQFHSTDAPSQVAGNLLLYSDGSWANASTGEVHGAIRLVKTGERGWLDMSQPVGSDVRAVVLSDAGKVVAIRRPPVPQASEGVQYGNFNVQVNSF